MAENSELTMIKIEVEKDLKQSLYNRASQENRDLGEFINQIVKLGFEAYTSGIYKEFKTASINPQKTKIVQSFILYLVKEYGITQTQLAIELKITPQNLNYQLRHAKKLDLGFYKKIIEVFNAMHISKGLFEEELTYYEQSLESIMESRNAAKREISKTILGN